MKQALVSTLTTSMRSRVSEVLRERLSSVRGRSVALEGHVTRRWSFACLALVLGESDQSSACVQPRDLLIETAASNLIEHGGVLRVRFGHWADTGLRRLFLASFAISCKLEVGRSDRTRDGRLWVGQWRWRSFWAHQPFSWLGGP